MNLPIDLGELLLSLEFKNGDLAPRLEFVALLAGRRVGLVDHAGAEFYEALDPALGRFSAYGQGKIQGSKFVYLVLLGIPCLPTAVEDIIPLLAVWPVKYPGKAL